MRLSLASQDRHRVLEGGLLWPFSASPLILFSLARLRCTVYLRIGNCSQCGSLPRLLTSLSCSTCFLLFRAPLPPFASLHSAKSFFPLGFFNALHYRQVSLYIHVLVFTARIVCSLRRPCQALASLNLAISCLLRVKNSS
jgi:hypothetical protein